MKNMDLKLLGLLFAIFLGLTGALGTNGQGTKPDDTSKQSALITEFDVNGLKVIVKRRASAPTVAVGLFVRGGVRNVDAKNAGIENLMLQAALESGKKYPKQSLRRELSRTASVLGAGTSLDFSSVSLVSTRQNFDLAWDMFTDVMMNPAFAAEDVDREKQQIITGLRAQDDDPDNALQSFQSRIIYAGHPYSNDPTGSIANVTSFTPADLAAYHKKIMETSRLLLVVVGDIDPSELKAKVTATLGKLPHGDYKEAPLPALDFSKPTLDVSSRSIPTNYVEGVFSAPPLSSADYYPMRVATAVLQEMVFQEVRVRRNLSYAPSADMAALAANTGNIYVTAVDANQAVSVMLDQMNTLKTQTLTDERLSGLTGEFLTSYYVRQETNAAQAGELARYELLGGGWRNSFEFINKIKQVKGSDVRTAANRYMKNLRFVVIGNPAAINKAVFVPAE